MKKDADCNSLRPNERIQKILLSTPPHFVGEFDAPDLLISLAWPPIFTGKSRWFGIGDDSMRRSAIIVAFRTPEPPKPAPGIMVPNYENAGEIVASAFSVLFGKRFDSHGPLEMSGMFGMPELSTFSMPCDPRLRHNDGRSRADRPVPLNLAEVGRIAKLIYNSNENPRVAAFHSAAKFYRRALLTIEQEPEGAYLNLITAGEIISAFHILPEAEVLDQDVRAALERISAEMSDGPRIVRLLKARLLGVKRRFVSSILAKVDESFFDRREAEIEWGSFRKEDFKARIGAAYDLRSRFVHSGYPFGQWIGMDMTRFEVQFGTPVVADREMAKVLARAPLFSGLERVIRYALLTFASELGADVEVINRPSSAPR